MPNKKVTLMKKKNQYPIYEHWYKTLNWILDFSERIPKNARFSIASRLSNLSLDILDNIIDAIYSKNRRSFLNNINRLLEKLRVLMRLCYDRHYMKLKQYENITRAIEETGQMTGGWMKADGQTG